MAQNSTSTLATKPPKYFPELDFIKTLAIIMVVGFHFWGQVSNWHMDIVETKWFFDYFQTFDFLKLWKFIEGYLYLGVNLFVIASGFGLMIAHAKKIDFGEFFRKRIFRLIPGAVLSVMVLFLVKGYFLNDWRLDNWYRIFFPFLGGLNLFSDNWFFPPINGEMWFLGLVMQLYLLFPLLLWLLKKVGTKKFLWILFGVSVAFRISYYFYFHDMVTSLSYGLSVGRIFEFGFGMVLAKLCLEGKKLSPWWGLGILLFWGYFFSWSFPFTDSLLGISLFTVLWFLAGKINLNGNPNCAKIFRSIALQSYLMFLLHHPFIWILNKYVTYEPWSAFGLILFGGLFVFSYLIAWLGNLVLKTVRLQ